MSLFITHLTQYSYFRQIFLYIIIKQTAIIKIVIHFFERMCLSSMKQQLHVQLKQLREERHWSLEDLSKKTQIGVEKLAQYESGELIPSLQTILKLSTTLQVPATNLTDGLTK